ncbi:hypothetical protein [Streptomyces sp. GZWMJZ-114]|uniref:hypothetical protein n=1 Tax=Streptomyces sp. GZWMJZ-114 TaxID=2494734 RepID=UPI0010102483|nr:hypothetical protein [Streptomyces sp. GZWMJZ-114]
MSRPSVALAPYASEVPDLRGLSVRAGRLAYGGTELPGDRDEHGVLWTRTSPRAPGDVQQRLGDRSPRRQRKLMRHLLCQVCEAPAHRDPVRGVTLVLPYAARLALLRLRHRPYGAPPLLPVEANPPVCGEHARTAPLLCPVLRTRGWTRVTVAAAPVHGVAGYLYDLTDLSRPPIWDPDIPYGDPRCDAVLATDLTRLLTLPTTLHAVPPLLLRKATP